MNKILLLLSGTILFFASCGTPKSTSEDDKDMEDDTVIEDEIEPVMNFDPQLHDIWVVTHIKGEAWPEGAPRARLEVFPGEGRIAGNGGCNEFFGGCTVNGANITFARIGTTKKFCKEAMALESEFLATLQDIDSYQIKGLQMLMGSNGSAVLTFQKVD